MNDAQAILFNKNMWSEKDAKNALNSLDLHPIKEVHITKNYLRYRIKSPKLFKSFRTEKYDNGIDIVIGYK